jgi:hypothetical protein
MPSDLRVICEELRQIGLRKETPSGREKLNESLSSKWDGVRVAAAKALSQWGDARSVRNLRELLTEVAGEPRRLSTTRAVVKLLRPHLQFSDLDWAINIFVHRSRGRNRPAVAGLFQAFPPNEVRDRLIAQKLHGGTAERDVRAAIAGAEWRARTTTGSK